MATARRSRLKQAVRARPGGCRTTAAGWRLMPGTEEVPDVDHGTTASSRAPWAALPERPDRRRVGAGRALHPAREARRPSAHGGRARGAERAPLRAGDRCQWRALPEDLPPRSTVHGYLTLWAWDGTLRRLHHAPFVQAREQEPALLRQPGVV